MTDLRHPIGKFQFDGEVTDDRRRQWIEQIAETPAKLGAAVEGLLDEQLDTPYRPGGWTARQVVHHLADSHRNGYVRFKLALTEAEPAIKPYDEAQWAELEDGRAGPVSVSLLLLESLHRRWVSMLRSLRPEDLRRTFRHPELGIVTLERNLALYAWHGRHHVAPITSFRERMGWR